MYATFKIFRREDHHYTLAARRVPLTLGLALLAAAAHKHSDRHLHIEFSTDGDFTVRDFYPDTRQPSQFVYCLTVGPTEGKYHPPFKAGVEFLMPMFRFTNPKSYETANLARVAVVPPLYVVGDEAEGWDMLGFILAFEGGELDEAEVIDGLTRLRDNGMLWQLQGFYGRTAHRLGLI